jgi:hypothetical protein
MFFGTLAGSVPLRQFMSPRTMVRTQHSKTSVVRGSLSASALDGGATSSR